MANNEELISLKFVKELMNVQKDFFQRNHSKLY